ncbi:fumarylacetoacetate hydrolase family protein [Noviherbaspirillum sp.]|jgi:2-keto-4-pentenoate hydratase|uniref:2-keto-4-pentenoate hydratase n=1 Tax=Noviherbaspirillum sp. TaxID=1926288 RepID=UPI0025FFE915|nr:fumarylacetoacetate hydrolase family protein [Noviherbaspirillum sp.]
MSNQTLVKELAARLRSAENTRQPVAPVRGEIALDDMAAAYAVQQANVDARVANGERIVGRKIGLTSFADMAYGDGEPMPLSRLIQPKAEAEIALVLKHDLTRERHTFADIIGATDYALAAIEVVDSRIQHWDIRFVDTVADNASSALFVLGSRPVPLADLDLVAATMTLSRDGEVLSRGSGAACLGNPLNAAVWLADMMVKMNTPLRAGDVLMTGALGPMVPVTQPGTFTAQIDGLGSVRAVFSE